MRCVTLFASISAETRYRVVLENEWSGLVRVTSDALALERTLSQLRSLSRVNRVAVATNELTFRNRMMEVQSELRNLFWMALTTKFEFIRLEQHLLFGLTRGSNDVSRIDGPASIDLSAIEYKVCVRVNLVTGDARQICLCVP